MKDGGPAFPLPGYDDPNGNITYPESGMSIRDWFAGQALAVIIGHKNYSLVSNNGKATAAYLYADAMLKAREESK